MGEPVLSLHSVAVVLVREPSSQSPLPPSRNSLQVKYATPAVTAVPPSAIIQAATLTGFGATMAEAHVSSVAKAVTSKPATAAAQNQNSSF